MLNDIKAITFDVDGTLYSVKKLKLLALLSMPHHIKFLKIFSNSRELIRKKNLINKNIEFEGFNIFEQQIKMVANELNISNANAEKKINKLIYKKLPELLKYISAFSGVDILLKELTKKEIKFGIISDYPSEEKINRLNLNFYNWEFMISGDRENYLKPHKRVFEKAVQLLNIKPENILHVGDREDCDILGAKSAGFKTALYVNNINKLNIQSRADLIFNNYTDLQNFITIV